MHVKQSSSVNCLSFPKPALSHSFLHQNSLREDQECGAERYHAAEYYTDLFVSEREQSAPIFSVKLFLFGPHL